MLNQFLTFFKDFLYFEDAVYFHIQYFTISRQNSGQEVCHPRFRENMFKTSNNLSKANELELFAFISYFLAQSLFHILLQPHQFFFIFFTSTMFLSAKAFTLEFYFLGLEFCTGFYFLGMFLLQTQGSFLHIIALFSFIFLQGTYCSDCRKYLVYSFGFCFS